jgi:hypothetical protein
MKSTYKLSTTTPLVLAAGLLAFSASAQHYVAGLEGIKAATLPPPGLYFRDYNLFYYAGDPNLFPLKEVFSYVNEPRLIWMTGQKILGADYGMDLIVPFGYAKIEYLTPGPAFATLQQVSADRFGLRDIEFSPLLLGWHLKQFDITGGYAFWAPSGDFDLNHTVNIALGFWTHMLSAGATWYPDEEKTWALSLLNRYEINQEQQDTGITPGQTLTMEWGLSKTLQKVIDVGVVGYWQQQATEDEGGPSGLSHVVALGPEVRTTFPDIDFVASLRYLREFEAHDRPEGNTITLTLTKRF